MERTLRFLERSVAFVGIASAMVLLPLLIGVRCYEIVMRKVFNAPSSFLQAIEWEALTLLILLSLGFAYIRNAHVRVDVLRDTLRPGAKAGIELAGYLVFVLPFTLVLIATSIEYAAASHGYGERSALANWGPYKWLIKGALAYGFGLFLLAATLAAIRNLRFLLSGQGGPAPDHGAGR